MTQPSTSNSTPRDLTEPDPYYRGPEDQTRDLKICANSIQKLQEWASDQHAIIHNCKDCIGTKQNSFDAASRQPTPRSLSEYYTNLNLDVSKALSSPDLIAKISRKSKSDFPNIITVTTQVYCRDPNIVAAVLRSANGICQQCKKPGPFLRASDNTVYLEVHHIQPLSENGADTMENSIALCPNCHRERHHGIEYS
jgi:hypothetical protein